MTAHKAPACHQPAWWAQTVSELEHWNESLVEQHVHLRKLLEEVNAYLSLPEELGSGQSLLPVLERLAHCCRRHMEFEEQDGYMAPIRQEHPHLNGQIDELLREHTTLQEDFAEVLRLVRTESRAAELRSTIVPKLKAWLSHIQQHERRENLLVQDAFNTKLGAGD